MATGAAVIGFIGFFVKLKPWSEEILFGRTSFFQRDFIYLNKWKCQHGWRSFREDRSRIFFLPIHIFYVC
jgi:hypothetical protein